MRLARIAWAILLIVGLSPTIFAQDIRSATDPESLGFSASRLAQIAPWYQTQIDAGALPGAVVAIARHGKLAYLQAIGFQDRDKKTALKPDAIFWIASMTKPVTSVAAMMLVDEGKLDLTAPVQQYLPELKDLRVAIEKTDAASDKRGPAYEPQKRPMQVLDLLRHTAGLVYGEEYGTTAVHRLYDGLYGKDGVWNRDKTLADFTTKLATLPLAHQPGEVWEYSHAVDVLARVVEVASGEPFDQFLESRLFKPLGMVDTGFYVPEAKLARLVDPPPGGRAPVWDVTKPTKLFSGGGGLVSTAPDYLRFCQMLLNGGELNGVHILSSKTVKQMTTSSLPPDIRFAGAVKTFIGPRAGSSWGLGFAVRTDPEFSVIPGTVGSFTWNGLWGTYFWIDPGEKLIAVLMIQVDPAENRQFARALRFLTYAALRDRASVAFTPPANPVTVNAGALATYVGTYDFGASISASDKQAPGSAYVGLGVDIAMWDGLLKVRAPYPNGPASRAGVMAGDVITQLDDTPVTGLSLDQVQGRLRGPVDTQVRLKIMHPGQNSPIDITAVREARGPPLVRLGMEIAMVDGVLRVRAPSPNGAASRAGVLAGDIITHVDDTPINGLSLDQVQRKLRGPVDTQVRLKIMHPGQNSPVDVPVVRKLIVGLGMEIAIADGVLWVRAPYPNWPAAKAGVMAGDIITHVDDTPINGLSLVQVQGKLRGPVDTQVRLKIMHAGQNTPVDVTIVRKLIVGLGMEIAMQDGALRVRASSPNAPASKAGVMAGDIITHVDDAPINSLNLDQVLDRLRGPIDTQIRLKIMHRGQYSPLDVTVVRKMVRVPGAELKVRMEAERLVIESTGPWAMLDFDMGKPITVSAISDVEFYVAGGEHTRIVFTGDRSGKITGAVLNPGPREIKGIRID